jgi:hypothetical protein
MNFFLLNPVRSRFLLAATNNNNSNNNNKIAIQIHRGSEGKKKGVFGCIAVESESNIALTNIAIESE